MRLITLAHEEDFEGWRDAARALALAGVPASEVRWQVGSGPGALFANGDAPPTPPAAASAFSVPRPFIELARSVVCHADEERFALLYAFLLRLRARPGALGDGADPLLRRLEQMAREVRRDRHETRANQRFRDIETGNEAQMMQTRGAIGDNALAAWEALRAESKGCTRCHLYKLGTQAVFGEGPVDARIMFVGEQPGDQEDLAGRPFIGPAGVMLDQALAEAGVERAQTYVTNAVKHFKFERRGKRRIHQKPDGAEIEACRWWIEQERILIRPPITVALGATAARSLLGKMVTISGTRGKPHQLYDGGECWVTVHPSFLLRIPEPERKRDEYARFVEDLKRVKKRLETIAN
ncbi:MAG: UdgX family uracil-DNA binding protein [Sphingomonadales bacterium]